MSQEPNDFYQPAPQRRVPWLWIALAAAAGLLFFRSALTTHAGEGKKLVSLSLEPLTFAGDRLALDDLKGKVVVLNFWGPWCPPCRRELPHVAELASHYAGNSRCRVLAVSCGYGEPDPVSSLPELKEQTDEVLASMGLKLAVYADPDARTRGAVSEAVKFSGYPTTLVLDPQGVIRKVWTGYAEGDEQALAELVAALLEEKSA
ncbi:MAG TPA: TlpA disulfide reductase family protein [Pirellulales bacterium]|jgi:thiol-disulfide isomerase/thioredoxin|nr:TlpA disulfide reductase family protein [Pirellulales bacterium]